jgi:hypothetical protein
LTILELAQIAHEMNRVYCQLSGDDSVQPWEKATQVQRKGMIFGVVHQLRMPGADTTSLHRGVMRENASIPKFDEMPHSYKAKTVLFAELVKLLKPFVKEE